MSASLVSTEPRPDTVAFTLEMLEVWGLNHMMNHSELVLNGKHLLIMDEDVDKLTKGIYNIWLMWDNL